MGALAIAPPTHAASTSSKKNEPPRVLEDDEAQAHFDRAQDYFAAEDYAAAIPELKAAYGLEPNPMLLYAWAQAERLAGSCARAVELYRRFLKTEPEADQRQLAEANLLDCEAELPSSELTPEPAPAPEPKLPPEAPATDDGPVRPWFKDPAGGVLVGLGAAGITSGGVLMGLARRRGKQAPNADIEDDYLATRDQAVRMNTAGIVVLGVGSALLVSAVIRYVVVAKKRRKRSTASTARFTPWWTGAGVGVGSRGEF